MSSKDRKERILRLEKERDHYIRNRTAQISESDRERETSHSRQGQSDDYCLVSDYGGIKDKFNISKDGKQYFRAGELSLLRDHGETSYEGTKNHIDAMLQAHKDKADAFDNLVRKETSSRAKYYKSDKTQLEEERARYASLEDAYEQLLKQVQQLQTTHLQDLRISEQRFHSASSALQKALISKAEELVTLSNKLASSEGRYERDSREWAKERVNIMTQLEALAAKDAEQHYKLEEKERKLVELNKLRKELAERIASREQDLIKYGKALREIEGDYNSEKEKRMQVELQLLKVEQEKDKRNADLQELQIAYQRKQTEAEELSNLKLNLSEVRRTNEDLLRREKQYLGEIEQMATRERKLFSQVEELEVRDRKQAQEMAKMVDKQAQLLQQTERLAEHEKKLMDSNDALIKDLSSKQEEIQKLERALKQHQLDSTRVLSEFSTLQNASQALKTENQDLSKELNFAKNDIELLRKERETLMGKVASLTKELQSTTLALEESNSEKEVLSERLDGQIALQNENLIKNKEKFSTVSTKIVELQNTLAETQQQLAELRMNEKSIRNALGQKEESLRTQSQHLLDAEARIQELLNSSTKEQQEYESFKTKKRDEILSIQDKYAQAKQAMDAEINQMRFQISQKNNQLTNVLEDASNLKEQVSELLALKSSMESKISELIANESNQQRQLANLTNNINQKQQELTRHQAKQQSLLDQIKRLEEELNLYRETNNSTRDSDIHRLQSNMDEISKRLKTQVEVLLDKDAESTHSRTHSRSNSTVSSPLKSRYSIVGVNSPVVGRASVIQSIPEPASEDAEFENLEKLLNKAKPFAS